MKSNLKAVSVAVGCLALSATASPAADRAAKTTYYSISGIDGAQLYKSMVERSPRKGWLSRAIGKTDYEVRWQPIKPLNGTCPAVASPPAVLITYTFPKPDEPLSSTVQRRWNKFMAGVRRHEEQHARLARQMANAAYLSVKGLKVAGDPSCSKTRSEVTRRVKAVEAVYEERQAQFDQAEHRPGGSIARLVAALKGE